MWNKTKITQLLGIEYPIIQGPFGGKFSSAKLVSTVSNAGGMGSFGLNSYSPDEILQVNTEINALTSKPYALNLWVPLKEDPVENYHAENFEPLKELFRPYFQELKVPLPEMPAIRVMLEKITSPQRSFENKMEAVLQAQPPVVSFIYGIPTKEIIRELKRKGIVSIATATTVEEALRIEEAGIDLVVASGSEAGGHRASFLKPAEESLTPTFSLVSEIAAKVKIPIIAAGGISNGKAIVSAMNIGASAVQMGTAFLATRESNASLPHKEKLLSGLIETALTKAYSGRLARVISNKITKEFEGDAGAYFAPYPIQGTFLGPLMKAAVEQNKPEYVAFWSGQPSAVLKHKSAAALFQALIDEVSVDSSSLGKALGGDFGEN